MMNCTKEEEYLMLAPDILGTGIIPRFISEYLDSSTNLCAYSQYY